MMCLSYLQGVSVDSDEGQEEGDAVVRVSPLEEFNTLHRHREGVRKSIKLKESSIVWSPETRKQWSVSDYRKDSESGCQWVLESQHIKVDFI